MAEWTIVAMAALGLVELLLRAVIVLALTIATLALIWAEADPARLLQPVLFEIVRARALDGRAS